MCVWCMLLGIVLTFCSEVGKVHFSFGLEATAGKILCLVSPRQLNCVDPVNSVELSM